MAKAFFTKINGALHPNSDHDRELLSKIPSGTAVQISYSKVRNYQFHRKYFALLNFAYDIWEPPEIDAASQILCDTFGSQPEKNFDEFRKNISVMAGFYTAMYDLRGNVHFRAKSISFASMDEITFEDLYTKTIDVIVKHICRQYTGDSLRAVLAEAEAFE